MNLYAVAASNRYFWQTLHVVAPDRDGAATAFRVYLAAPQQQAAEAHELAEGADYAPDESNERDDYVYAFDNDDIELIDDDYSGKVGAAVVMTDSGGNG